MVRVSPDVDREGVPQAVHLLTESGVESERVPGHRGRVHPVPRRGHREPRVGELGLLDGNGVSDDEPIALIAEHPNGCGIRWPSSAID